MTAAFARQDNAQILKAMRVDVVFEVPGRSALAGHHVGSEAVGRFLAGLERVFVPAQRPIQFSHAGNDMLVTQILRSGIKEWTHHYRITFDRSERIARIVFEPDDIDGFDALVGTTLGEPKADS